MAEGRRQRLGEITRYGFDWSDYLALRETVTDSDWSVSPNTGLTLSAFDIASPETSTLTEATAAGAYRVTNTVTMSDGSSGVQDLLIAVEGATLGGSYLTADMAEARLFERYGIESEIFVGDLVIASRELDARPLVGEAYDATAQSLAFPRSYTVPGDEAGMVPEAILDWVALRAYQLATEDEPAVASESAGRVSVSYFRPKISQLERRMRRLLAPYLAEVHVV